MITHVVLFKFESPEHAEKAVELLLGMKGNVPSLLDVEAGVDVTKSARSYQVGLITRHKSRSDLDAYREDPFHKRVAEFVGAHSSGAVAVDFES
jgi:hypothetical protein